MPRMQPYDHARYLPSAWSSADPLPCKLVRRGSRKKEGDFRALTLARPSRRRGIRKSRFKPVRMLRAIRQVEGGTTLRDINPKRGVTASTLERWQKHFRLDVSELRELRVLSEEETTVHRVVANLVLDKTMQDGRARKQLASTRQRRDTVVSAQSACRVSERGTCRTRQGAVTRTHRLASPDERGVVRAASGIGHDPHQRQLASTQHVVVARRRARELQARPSSVRRRRTPAQAALSRTAESPHRRSPAHRGRAPREAVAGGLHGRHVGRWAVHPRGYVFAWMRRAGRYGALLLYRCCVAAPSGWVIGGSASNDLQIDLCTACTSPAVDRASQ